MEGGPGEDFLDGGWDNDHLNGGANNDTMWGGYGSDYLFGDSGDDKLYGGSYEQNNNEISNDAVTFFDILQGGGGNDELHHPWY